MSVNHVLDLIESNNIRFVDLRFTDTKGKEQHVTLPSRIVDEAFLSRSGKAFDGSSIAGWKGINDSDMVLMPDTESAVIDPFCDETTLNLRCDILEPSTMTSYTRDPRSVAKRAEMYLRSTGIADSALFGPEPEFFLLDDVRWQIDMRGASYSIDSDEGAWNTNKHYDKGNSGHRP